MAKQKSPKTGRHSWLPFHVIDEVDDIKRENRLERDSQAFTQLVKYARVGRELERIAKLSWKDKMPRPIIDDLDYDNNSKRKRKKNKNQQDWGLKL